MLHTDPIFLHFLCVQKEGGEKKADGGKKVEAPTIVLKIDMHCEGCVKKIIKSVKKFEGT